MPFLTRMFALVLCYIAEFIDECVSSYAAWLGTVAGRYYEDGKLSEVIPSIDESRHRLATCAGTSTCHIVQVIWVTLKCGEDLLTF